MKDNKTIAEVIRNCRSKGMPVKVIAYKLGISESSVRTYIREGK